MVVLDQGSNVVFDHVDGGVLHATLVNARRDGPFACPSSTTKYHVHISPPMNNSSPNYITIIIINIIKIKIFFFFLIDPIGQKKKKRKWNRNDEIGSDECRLSSMDKSMMMNGNHSEEYNSC